MTEILLEAGTLAEPACYATEQERFDAYVAALTATLQGDLDWIVQALEPSAEDIDRNWLRLDANGRPVMAYRYNADDAAWVPWFGFPIFGTSTGAAGAYSLTNTPAFTTSGEAYQIGRKYVFKANHATTGASTLEIDGLGAKAIKVQITSPTVAGSIKVDQIVEVVYDGVNFQMVSTGGRITISAEDLDPGTDGQALRTRDVSGTLTSKWETNRYATADADLEACPTVAGTKTEFTHGLTVNGAVVVPVSFGVRLVCQTSELGYGVGQEVNVPNSWDTDGDRRQQWLVYADSSKVYVIFLQGNPTGLFLPDLSTGIMQTATAAKWKLKAWAII